MDMNKKMVVGNWKMNPATIEESKQLSKKIKAAAEDLKNVDVVICPPFPFIYPAIPKEYPENFHIGAQSVSCKAGVGSHTGEVSAIMLKDLGVEYVIVGHSEQRAKGDSDETVSMRLKNVLDQGMKPIVCVGEAVRDAEGAYLEGLKNQIKNTLANVPKKFVKEIVIAYEPVWAIGATEAMRPEDIYETSLFVKKIFADVFTPDVGVKTKVLYGGSVNAINAGEIMFTGKVDGLLVGRESVSPSGFVDLLKAVAEKAG